MDFLVPAGSATNLPKEMVDEVMTLITEKSKVYKLIVNRGQAYELKNEGTIPVLSEANEDRVYLADGTDDITTLTENSFDINSPDLVVRELASYFYLKKKHQKQYTEIQLEKVYKDKLSTAMAKKLDKIILVGDTSGAGATNADTIADGIHTIAADATLCSATAVTYTTSQTQDIINAVIDGKGNMGAYADEEYADDLFLFASQTFYSSAKKNADKDIIGFDYDDVPELGLRKVPHIDGVPVLRRTNITGEQAVLNNISGARVGYLENIEVDVQWKSERRAWLNVITYWFDFVWAFVNSSSKNEGICLISKSSS